MSDKKLPPLFPTTDAEHREREALLLRLAEQHKADHGFRELSEFKTTDWPGAEVVGRPNKNRRRNYCNQNGMLKRA